MNITIIIPTYNEAENLPKLVSALFSLNLDIRLLIVDDNSPDGTGEIADSLAADYLDKVKILHREGKLGLRTAYLTGIELALATETDAIAQNIIESTNETTSRPKNPLSFGFPITGLRNSPNMVSVRLKAKKNANTAIDNPKRNAGLCSDLSSITVSTNIPFSKA